VPQTRHLAGGRIVGLAQPHSPAATAVLRDE